MGAFSIWHWLVLLLVFLPPGAVIYVAVKRVRAEKRARTGITPGFKGWLFILAVGQWLNLLYALISIGKYLADEQNKTAMRLIPAIYMIDICVLGISLAFAVVALWTMLHRARTFPRVYKLMFVWAVAAAPLNAFLSYLVVGAYYGRPELGGLIWAELAKNLPSWLGGVLGLLPWLLYVVKSRRVEMTFTR